MWHLYVPKEEPPLFSWHGRKLAEVAGTYFLLRQHKREQRGVYFRCEYFVALAMESYRATGQVDMGHWDLCFRQATALAHRDVVALAHPDGTLFEF